MSIYNLIFIYIKLIYDPLWRIFMKGGWLSSCQPLFCEVALGLQRALRQDFTWKLWPKKLAACPFIQLPGQLLLSVLPALIRRYTPLSQVCITMELRMRGTQAPPTPGVPCWRLVEFGVWDAYEEDLVLTPQAGAFVLSGPAPTDGTVLGYLPPRLLACVRGLITCHLVIILTSSCFLFFWGGC